jgi:hypothetical protein
MNLRSAVNPSDACSITIKGRLAEGYSAATELSIPLPRKMYLLKPVICLARPTYRASEINSDASNFLSGQSLLESLAGYLPY